MPNDEPVPVERLVLDTRGEWLAAVRAALLALPDGTAREAILVDVDFDEWPLGEPEVVDALTRWLRLPARRLRLAGLSFDGMERSQARFAAWRRHWAHAVEPVSPADVAASDMPSMLLVAELPLAIERIDRDHWRTRVTQDTREVRLAVDRIAAILQRSGPAWPANALGL